MAHPARFELTPVPPRVARQMNFSISPRRRKRDARSGATPSSSDLPPKRAFAALPIGILSFVFALVGPIAVHAEVISTPSADRPSSAASPPPPTVLRGSPTSTARLVPICPPGYTLSSGYGCIGPSSSDYTEGWPTYDYWPDYGYGYPFGGFPGFGFGAGRFHRFAGFHGRGRFQGRGFHGRAAFPSAARFGGFSPEIGHIGGFGRR
jgi:hypothetical protein